MGRAFVAPALHSPSATTFLEDRGDMDLVVNAGRLVFSERFWWCIVSVMLRIQKVDMFVLANTTIEDRGLKILKPKKRIQP